ncbi:hypothetical protein [Streptomyces sp. NPDC005799]|uniref:hypothetical protein n=1 Tax=Streptomyces sp. NPDC005799 TaxID=3154678 RepID=UPI0033E4F0E0
MRRSSSISMPCVIARPSIRESRRGKQTATAAISDPNAAVQTRSAIVASRAT